MVFISGNVPSLKNSKIKTSRGIFPSKTVMKYLRNKGIQKYSASQKTVTGYKSKDRPNIFQEEIEQLRLELEHLPNPVLLGFHFVRDANRKFDFHNAVQIIADLLTAHGVIEDDNMDYFIPCPLSIEGRWYTVDKEKAGVFIKVL